EIFPVPGAENATGPGDGELDRAGERGGDSLRLRLALAVPVLRLERILLPARTRRRGRSRRRQRAAEHQAPTPAGLAHRLAEIARALRVHSKKMLSAGGSANTGEMKDDFAALDRPPKRRAVNDISIHQINWQAGQLGQIARPSHQAANLPTEAKELPR